MKQVLGQRRFHSGHVSYLRLRSESVTSPKALAFDKAIAELQSSFIKFALTSKEKQKPLMK